MQFWVFYLDAHMTVLYDTQWAFVYVGHVDKDIEHVTHAYDTHSVERMQYILLYIIYCTLVSSLRYFLHKHRIFFVCFLFFCLFVFLFFCYGIPKAVFLPSKCGS